MATKVSDELVTTDNYFNTLEDFDIENKQAGFNDEDQSFVGWLNREIWDHDDEMIKTVGWDLSVWDLNPVMMWVHKYDQKPLGTGLWAKRKTKETPPGLLWRPSFTTETQEGIETYKLYKARIIRAFSAGFKPQEVDTKTDKKGRSIFAKALLLEGSVVPIPANFLSLTLALENDFITSKMIKASFDEILAQTDSKLFQTDMEDRELEFIEKSFGKIKEKRKYAKDMATPDQIGEIWSKANEIQNLLKEIGSGYVSIMTDRIEISQTDPDSDLWRRGQVVEHTKDKEPDIIKIDTDTIKVVSDTIKIEPDITVQDRIAFHKGELV